MPPPTEPYLAQIVRWPSRGRHILAHDDATSVAVYQAYRPNIGRFAATHGYFGGAFSLDRTSWIKPNVLWMMFRNGWGTKERQEVTLAVRLARAAFDEILATAISSSLASVIYASEQEWASTLRQAAVVYQWDPDHDPSGRRIERRAIQLGLRGTALFRICKIIAFFLFCALIMASVVFRIVNSWSGSHPLQAATLPGGAGSCGVWATTARTG